MDVKRILLVEDEELLLLGLAAALTQMGCAVQAVACGADAFTAMNTVQYDVCFLDVQLPDMNGLEMVRAIKQISPGTKIVVMTALDLTERQIGELHADACHFLPKPFGLEAVRSLVLGSPGNGAAAPE